LDGVTVSHHNSAKQKIKSFSLHHLKAAQRWQQAKNKLKK
jgi:hypothetical protein